MWLGTFSYSMYLIHMVVIPFPDAGLRKLGFEGPLYIITYLVQLLTAVSAGWFFFALVERRFISKRMTTESKTDRA
jgi:peptidoglycan/LPS O-acetylase OafA/YrhL